MISTLKSLKKRLKRLWSKKQITCRTMTNDNMDTDHPPDTDIDDYIENVNFRIERMGEDAVWLAAYTRDDDDPIDHHFDITVSDDGLHIRHRREDMEEYSNE